MTSVADPPADFDGRLSVRVERAEVTPEATARVRIALTNAGETAEEFLGGVGPFPFGYGENREGPLRVWLRNENQVKGLDPDEGRWVADGAVVSPARWGRATLQPGASAGHDAWLWAHRDADAYLSPGVYRFETSLRQLSRFPAVETGEAPATGADDAVSATGTGDAATGTTVSTTRPPPHERLGAWRASFELRIRR